MGRLHPFDPPWLVSPTFAHHGFFLNPSPGDLAIPEEGPEAGRSLARLTGQPLFSIVESCWVEFLSSVHSQLTGYLLGLLGHSVGPLEVLVAGGTAQPGLPKVDATGEEEAARPRLDAALQQSPDLPLAGQPTVPSEQGVLLTEHPGGADLDHSGPEVLVFLH